MTARPARPAKVAPSALAADAWHALGAGSGLTAPLRWRGLLGLTYHRVGDHLASPLDRGVFSCSAEAFDAQMAFLARHFDVIALQDLPLARRDPRGRYVMVTFDDGYRDNYDVAFPILKAHRIPATFFLTTGFLDDQPLAWWDRIAYMVRTAGERAAAGDGGLRALPERPEGSGPGAWGGPLPLTDPASRELALRAVLRAYYRLPAADTAPFLDELRSLTGVEPPAALADRLWMTWGNVRELRLAGMGIGGHTHTHPLLARLGPADQVAEVRTCRDRLLDAAGVRTRGFAYPVGTPDSFNTMTRAILLAHGFDLAFTFYGGHQTMPDIDFLDIRRTAVSRATTQKLFEAKATLPRLFAR